MYIVKSIIASIQHCHNMACTIVTVNELFNEKIYDAMNQIRYKRKQHSDSKGIYDYLIKADGVVNMTLEALEERVRTL